jgi:hypothetical protein
MSTGASIQTAAETPERSSVRIGHEALTPTALDYADADDDADDYDYESSTEGPSEIVYAPEDDVDPPDSSGVNSDGPSDSDGDEIDATSLGGGSGTARTNAVINVWQAFSEEDIDTSSRGQYDGGPLEAANDAAALKPTDERRGDQVHGLVLPGAKDERTVCALRKVSE